ncbi:MAG: DUF4176 domain-containing protein [Bacilli bacterium]|nr:DUF4176 domain-containing protein [Bacilli bacterium]
MNEKFKRYLPIGSVVLMKDAKKRVMITGYAVKSPDFGEKVFDYIGCLFPEGVIAPDKNLLFDHKDIRQIFAIGYSDEEQKNFSKKLDEATAIREAKMNKENTVDVDNNN